MKAAFEEAQEGQNHATTGASSSKVLTKSSTSTWEANRSRRILEVAQYNWLLVPILLAIVYPLLYRLHSDPSNQFFYVPVDDSTKWSRGVIVWLLIALPSKLYHHTSMIATFWPCRPSRLTNRSVVRPFNRLLICLVTRGEQKSVVERSLLPVQGMLPSIHPRVSLHILTEERNSEKFWGAFSDHVKVHGVPASYRPRVAKHKARSLEWFRINMNLQDDDWILHIDEETLIDEYCVRKCLEFITKQDADEIGTGVIHFTIEPFGASSTIASIGDLGRVQADWGRCQWGANYPHQAALGIHGAFFLSSGKVENAITWETAHLTEDYWFLHNAMAKGFRIGWVPAIAREVSPRSVGDYIRQRRRWFTGIRTLGQIEGQWLMATWLWGFVEALYALWRMAVPVEVEPVPGWLFCAIIFEVSLYRLLTFLTVLVQDYDAGVSLWSMVYSQVLAQLLRPFVSLLDSCAVVLSLLMPDEHFHIVQKS